MPKRAEKVFLAGMIQVFFTEAVHEPFVYHRHGSYGWWEVCVKSKWGMFFRKIKSKQERKDLVPDCIAKKSRKS